ncbi:MAG TPA: DUF2147 domain-containing protein [Acetobacteraceae bacterium]|nr:DUF2147 domain-containing protein [Acetobacteraceae bacterium]
MVRALGLLAVVAVALVSPSAVAGAASTPLGNWSTEGGHGVIAIAPCGEALCGRIVGIERAPDEPMPTDVQGRPQCELTIIRNEMPTEDGRWRGDVTNPRDGKTYRALLWVDDAGRLNLRGYIGIPLLGSTQIWNRYPGRLSDGCRIG